MIEEEQLVKLSEEISRLALDLSRIAEGDDKPEPCGPPQPRLDVVTTMISARQKRGKYLPCELFADPAWDMLLELLHAELSGRNVCITSLCGVAGVPQTTALRWIHQMIDQGLLLRRKDKDDGRRIYLELAAKVSGALRRYFVEVVEPKAVAG